MDLTALYLDAQIKNMAQIFSRILRFKHNSRESRRVVSQFGSPDPREFSRGRRYTLQFDIINHPIVNYCIEVLIEDPRRMIEFDYQGTHYRAKIEAVDRVNIADDATINLTLKASELHEGESP